MYEPTPSISEQEKILDQSTQVIKVESSEMKRCLDKGKTMDALKHAMKFLEELRTSQLSPKFYYRLYMDSINELQHLETALADDFKHDPSKLVNLYECVQYSSTIVPRLYLLVTIGVVFIKCGLGSRKELLLDMVEMCRGIQHPLRGLFLRNYLLQSTRSLLPDASDNENDEVLEQNGDARKKQDGTVTDAVDFILLNFAEMNKLWVRMQHQGPSREKEKREKDRMELRILVGTNLVRLSQLEGLTQEMYSQVVLPSILEQIVSCRDPISQEYLMECVIQVFADEFHLATLTEFLAACGQLVEEVNVKNVLIALIERLALYTTSEETDEENGPDKTQLFEIFSKQAKDLIKARPQMPVEDIVSLHVALVSLAIKSNTSRVDFADMSLSSLIAIMEEKGIRSVEAFGTVGRELYKLLHIPIDEYNNVLKLADLTQFPAVINLFDYRGRCTIAGYIVQNVLDQETWLKSEHDVNVLCKFIEVLLTTQPDEPEDNQNSEDFIDEQHLVARVIHMIRADDPEEQFQLLNNLRKLMAAGGTHRLQYTLPPIAFELYRLILSIKDKKDVYPEWDEKVRRIFVCAMGTIGALAQTAELTELPLKLYLEGAIAADKVAFDDNHTVVYEFMAKALSIQEDGVADSKERIRCLNLIVGALLATSNLPAENWEPLTSQAYLAAAKIFKKPDQVRCLCTVANLYWHGRVAEGNGETLKNGKKVADILRKASKIASECMERLVQQQLFISLINVYMQFQQQGCQEINMENIEELVARTQKNTVNLDVSAEADALERELADAVQRLKLVQGSQQE